MSDDDVCPTCRIQQSKPNGIFTPINLPGVLHHSDCPTLPRLSTEDAEALRRDLDDMAHARSRAWHESRNIWIGS